jgi:hypothetical protein
VRNCRSVAILITCGHMYATVSLTSDRALAEKMVSPDVLRCRFIHTHARNFFYIFRILMTRRFHHPNFVIYVYPEPSNHHLDSKTICEKFSSARIQQKHLGSFFAALNGDCSIQDGCRELKLVWLEPSGHKDSEYVRKYFLAHL